MQHLMLEALARLVEDTPEGAEAEHLRECAACRDELEAMRRDAEALGRMGAIEPDAGDWDRLLARLRDERLVAGGASAWRGRLFRIAAALALYAAGTATGLGVRARAALAPSAAPRAAQVATGATGNAAPVAAPAPSTTTASQQLASTDSSPAPRQPAAPASPDALNAADTGAAHPRMRPLPTTPEAAAQAVLAAERAYVQAYEHYSELAAPQQADDPVARVAALESIVLTTRQALDRAPADPVINGYHLTAVAQRDAALRQIALRSNSPWF